MLSIFIHSSMIIFLDRQQNFSLVYECREFPHCFLYAHHQIMFWLIVHQAKFSQAKVSAYTKNIWADISCAPTCQKSRWLLLIKKTSQAFPHPSLIAYYVAYSFISLALITERRIVQGRNDKLYLSSFLLVQVHTILRMPTIYLLLAKIMLLLLAPPFLFATLATCFFGSLSHRYVTE